MNGQAAEVLPASYAFRGVVMAAGRSEVSFSYEPASYRIGLFLGLASLAVVLAVAAAAFPLRRP